MRCQEIHTPYPSGRTVLIRASTDPIFRFSIEPVTNKKNEFDLNQLVLYLEFFYVNKLI